VSRTVDAPAGAPTTATPVAPRRAPGLVVALVAAPLLALLRWWQLHGRAPLSWQDTGDFAATAEAPWASRALWAGSRPPGVPVLLRLAGSDLSRYVALQAALAVACWTALAASVATVVRGRGRWVAAGAVVALAATTPVTMWERSVLSESPAQSLLALTVAAGLQVARSPGRGAVAATVAVAAAWLAVRDSHAAVALGGGAAALGVAVAAAARAHLAARRAVGTGAPAWARPLAALGAAGLALGALAMAGAAHGERHAFPTRNVYAVRILPYPERVEWFADHGMPQAEHFLGPDRRAPYVERGRAPVVAVPDGDPELEPWLRWVASEGRTALLRYMATHPGYLLAEPFRSPERAFNNADGDRGFYAAPDTVRAPLVDRLLAPSTPVVLAVGALLLGWGLGLRRWTPALVTGAAGVALAAVHGLVAWHGDGMETARHLVVPALQLRVGVLLLAVGLLPAPPGGAGEGGVPPGPPGGEPAGQRSG
jgi:hypothetical protein